jgi:SAM-dependent methyltransferase
MNCIVCALPQSYSKCFPVDEDLASTWGISSGLVARFNEREGLICTGCGSNVRAQGLASAIIASKFGFGAASLKEWVGLANKKKLKVLELNACHELHKVLASLRYLTYSEYGTKTEQDIENLTYKDNSYDLVLHSETLEHVNDPRRALDECRRVLKKDGLVIFTIPIVWTRKTRTRSQRSGNKITNILPPSYHGQRTDDYLVYTEFGSDVDVLLGCDILYARPAMQNYAFATGKDATKRVKWLRKKQFYIQEKVYERISVS